MESRDLSIPKTCVPDLRDMLNLLGIVMMRMQM